MEQIYNMDKNKEPMERKKGKTDIVNIILIILLTIGLIAALIMVFGFEEPYDSAHEITIFPNLCIILILVYEFVIVMCIILYQFIKMRYR